MQLQNYLILNTENTKIHFFFFFLQTRLADSKFSIAKGQFKILGLSLPLTQ